MRLHENKEGDELQRLRARRQGTGRNYKNCPRQTKTVDHTYDEDYYEEEDYDYEYEEEPDPPAYADGQTFFLYAIFIYHTHP